MKIHGTAKGGALSTKDFGVAFGGAAAPGFIVATGGTITIDPEGGDYKVHKFSVVGSATFEITSGSGDVEYLVLGAGGGGGRNNGGGSGAGAFRADTKSDMGVDEYDITIGEKGLGLTSSDSSPEDNGQGGDTVFSDITSNGGGYGGGTPAGTTGGNGGDSVNGSGGGARNNAVKGSSGAYGNDGGTGPDTSQGSGGGGASTAGQDAPGSNGGYGGNGSASDIIEDGTDVTYCGGGGGGSQGGSGGSGGSGGAGDGTAGSTDGGDATDYGSGGGGCHTGSGGDGYGGLVVLRYKFQ